MNNQKEHFQRMVASNAEELKKMNLSKGKLKPFLDQGAQWAKNSLGRKFTKNDFEKGSLKIYEQANEELTLLSTIGKDNTAKRVVKPAGLAAGGVIAAEDDDEDIAKLREAKKHARESSWSVVVCRNSRIVS